MCLLAVRWSYFFTLDARRLECVIKYLKLFNLELFHWKEILQLCKSKFVKRCDEELIKVDEYPDLFYLNMPDLIVGGRIRII